MTDKLIEAINDLDKMYGGPGMPTWDQCQGFNRVLEIYASELAEEIRCMAAGVRNGPLMPLQQYISGLRSAADLIDPEVGE